MLATTFQNALPAMLGVMSDSTGIRVRRGSPKTDGECVWLPRIGDFDVSKERAIRILAYCWHESGHKLMSDFTIEIDTLTDREREFMGVLEDLRIEYRLSNSYPSARYYLNALGAGVCEDSLSGQGEILWWVPSEDGPPPPAKLLQWHAYFLGRVELIQQAGVKPLLALSRECFEELFPENFRIRFEALVLSVGDCENEREVLALVREILKLVEEEAERPPEEGEPPPNPDPDASQSDGGGSPSGSSPPIPNVFQQALQDEVDVNPTAWSEAFAESLQAEEDSADDDQVSLPGSVVVARGGIPPDFEALRGNAAVLRQRAKRWFCVTEDEERILCSSGMKLHGPSLYRASTGGDVFVKVADGKELQSAISLAIDISGSMHGLLSQAIEAAIVALDAFSWKGVKMQLVCFPYLDGDARGEFDRVGILKDWEEPARNALSRIGGISANGGTPMAEAVCFSTVALLKRREKRKLCLVITDGAPSRLDATLAMVQRARRAGVVVAGLGIDCCTDHVFGEQFSASISDIDELPASLIRLLQRIF